MVKNPDVRWGWLKIMYIFTILTAGGTGLGMVFIPGVFYSISGWPPQEPLIMGIIASVFVSFGILSLFGLRSPLKFVPVLFLQLIYKSTWFIAIVLPLVISGRYPGYGILMAVLFAAIIVGDLIAIPFRYVFARQSGQEAQSSPSRVSI